MPSRNSRIRAAKDVKRRAKAPAPDVPQYCVVQGCHRPTQRSAGKGLSEVYCKRHTEHLRSHGHPTRRSYSKAELVPYRKAALEWYQQHQHEAHIRQTIAGLESLMSSQSRAKDAYHHRSMPPKDKARNTLARLHEAGKSGEQLFLIVLTIKAAHAELGPRGAPDWEAVQIAKQAKRLRGAAGTPTGLHRMPRRYPRGEGLYMRHLGQMIEERASTAISQKTIENIRHQARPPQQAWEDALAKVAEEKAQRAEKAHWDYLMRALNSTGSISTYG